MPANTTPIFPLTPNAAWSGNLTTGTNTYDGTSGTSILLTAGSSGAYLRSIEGEAAGTNTASVLRVFLNNGSTNATAGNNALIMQHVLPATTASATTVTAHISVNMGIWIPASYKIYVVLATTVAAGWQFTASYGDY